MQEKQRGNDLEEELQLIQKHLKTTQSKVAEQVDDSKNISNILNIKPIQSQEIANLKATKDVYDAQLTVFSNELLETQVRINIILINLNKIIVFFQNQLKEKQEQLDILSAESITRLVIYLIE